MRALNSSALVFGLSCSGLILDVAIQPRKFPGRNSMRMRISVLVARVMSMGVDPRC